MQKTEFENIVGDEVTDGDYEKIEAVYMWHPAISETDGKKQIADLYNMGGMGIISDMLPVAAQVRSMENEIERLQAEIGEIKKRYMR